MGTQIINLNNVNEVHFNTHTDVNEIKLNGNTIWAKAPATKPYLELKLINPNVTPKTFTISSNSNSSLADWNGTIQYSTDAVNWTTWIKGSQSSQPVSNAQGVLYLRGIGNTHISTSLNYGNLQSPFVFGGGAYVDGVIEITGNIETLLDYATVEQGNHPTMDDYCFCNLFRGVRISKAPELKATTLSNYCYNSMFYACSQLIIPPTELPANSVPQYAYAGMFDRCSSMTKCVSIKATQFYERACFNMFDRCTSMTEVAQVTGNYFDNLCFGSMFRDCSLIKMSNTQTGEYTNQYLLGGVGTSVGTPFQNMFYNTGGTSTPSAIGTYYTSNTVV